MTARKPARSVVDSPHAQGGVVVEPGLSDFALARWRAELLDPDKWGEILGKFGRTMKLAVALTDTDGKLLGPCHNPQPVWELVRRTSASGPACAFCLTPDGSCKAVADALASGEVVIVDDAAGLAHAAIPLILGTRPLGALIAGQIFAQYPQPLSLQRVAKYFGVPQQELWSTAVHEVPLSHATLRLYAELLESLGQAFLRQRYATILDRELVERDQRYRLMIEASTDRALFTVDRKGCVTSWNAGAERLLGYRESEISGKNYSLFFTAEDAQSEVPRREIQRAELNGWIEQEDWQVRKDGTRFLSQTVMSPLGEGGAREYGRLLHDVTAERKAMDAVMEAQKLESIGVLAGGIAHDFNNLLTSILGNVSLAMSGMPEDDSARPLLEIAERSSLKAAGLVAQLLAYAGKSNGSVRRFDVSPMIAEILPLIHTSIPKTVRLELDLQPSLPWIEADKIEIQQIVMNLVINGAEAIGPEGGVVQVTTGVVAADSTGERQSDGVFLEVRDSGSGMDEATQSRIFDPFFTTKFTGRGLGLAAVSGIVRRLSGRLEVKSALGEGSMFRIVFPCVPAGIAESLKAPANSVLDGTGTILVVDDDPMVLKLARVVLQRYGYSVLIAENGKAAMKMFRSHAEEISAVLMDLTMPVMGGGEAFQLMNEIRPNIPIVISSGYAETEVRRQFTDALAGVIQKPYTMAQLGKTIADALASKKMAGLRTSGAGS